jgi:hypothetical protein
MILLLTAYLCKRFGPQVKGYFSKKPAYAYALQPVELSTAVSQHLNN